MSNFIQYHYRIELYATGLNAPLIQDGTYDDIEEARYAARQLEMRCNTGNVYLYAAPKHISHRQNEGWKEISLTGEGD